MGSTHACILIYEFGELSRFSGELRTAWLELNFRQGQGFFSSSQRPDRLLAPPTFISIGYLGGGQPKFNEETSVQAYEMLLQRVK
jgi:hypothetical protein